MISKQEIITSLYGAYKLLLFEAQGIAFFSHKKAPARRSFWVPLIAFPLLIFMISFLRQGELADIPLHSFIIAHTLGLFFGISTFYLITHLFLEMLYAKKIRLFPRLVSSMNWSFALQAVISVVPILLFLAGLSNFTMTGMLIILITLVFEVYRAFIVKISLSIHWLWAIGLIIVKMALGDFFTVMLFARILQGNGG